MSNQIIELVDVNVLFALINKFGPSLQREVCISFTSHEDKPPLKIM